MLRRAAGRFVALAVLAVIVAVALHFHHGEGAQPAQATAAPPPAYSLVAHAKGHHLAVYRQPGAARPWRTMASPTAYREPLVLLVTEQQTGWVRVLLPVRPNGTAGWVRADAVTLTKDPYAVYVDRAHHRVTVTYAGRPVLATPAAVGARKTPTPAGTFYLTALLEPPNQHGDYGPYAYGLSGYSPTLDRFAGGDGQVGLHGTDEPSSIGKSVSHGCVRVPNAIITKLAELLPLGTPVVVA